ncbi:hypothetical protein GGG87_03760 [Streptococcus sp. zg-86]|uniref:Uncharacterized protein n=1 Tax=Streptococcus zhangguiae TaxID=2664091 RepID=A0A6I4R8J2_9STRE|nr:MULTISPECIES: hypothetical protein [unclassified Streptococcus]MTB64118.1 hypothetical protein [Streptococcus sp. zg-86]MTB90556.1 hypothetical protein [Streptococcus sp. zg-36]MWV56106.1 hypothetical protein [Streptococcus sp. zg-70]QTH48268.1 hypothetical protein J5M87_02760 [Streptococcus sp. zg-86]
MTSIPLKENLFREKMTAVRIVHAETGQLLGSANSMDFYPNTLSLFAIVDFFKIKPRTNYVLTVTVILPENGANLLYATRVNLEEEKINYRDEQGYGLANGSFDFQLSLNTKTDCLLLFSLIDEEGNELDTAYNYFKFI